MDKRTRAYKIYQAGLDELPDLYQGDPAILMAIAAMIDFATAKKKPKKKDEKLPFTEADVLRELPLDLEVARHGSLNRCLGSITTLRQSDLPEFISWFTECMQPWLESKDIPFTYSMLVRKFPEWLEKARQHVGKGHEPEISAWR